MKVLLISTNTLLTPYPVYPIGLDYVAAAISDRHTVRIADMNVLSVDELGTLCTTFAPEVIGLSIRNIDNTDLGNPKGFISDYIALINVLRNYSKAVIVLGGAGYSLFPRELITTLSADYGIVGEGERFADLLNQIEFGKPVTDLPGVVTPLTNYVSPFPVSGPAKTQFGPASDHLSFYLKRGGMLNLQTKRGCPFQCVYCTYPHIEGRKFRFFDPESVAKTAKALQDAGAKYIFIADSTFNADIPHSLAVATQFKRAGLSIPWGAFLSPMKMPKTYFNELATTGLTHVEFGTESLSNRVLSSYRKPFTREDIVTAHRAAIDTGLQVAHYFLFGGPGETPDTIGRSLTFIDKLEKSVLFLFRGMRIYPHTELFDIAAKEGQITPTQDLLNPVYYRSPRISDEEILAALSDRGKNRPNWVFGAGDEKTVRRMGLMYERGYTGPLWEYLIR